MAQNLGLLTSRHKQGRRRVTNLKTSLVFQRAMLAPLFLFSTLKQKLNGFGLAMQVRQSLGTLSTQVRTFTDRMAEQQEAWSTDFLSFLKIA